MDHYQNTLCKTKKIHIYAIILRVYNLDLRFTPIRIYGLHSNDKRVTLLEEF